VSEIFKARLSLIPALAEQHPAGHIGRTALMKYMYFLQTLRDVPLGYRFSMYSYGPFDSDVLADLSSAEALSAVKASPIQFPGGYGYQIRPAAEAKSLKDLSSSFLAKYQPDIDWVLTEFGGLNSADLELASTIIYVDREFGDAENHVLVNDIERRVSDIKPHFSKSQISGMVNRLLQTGLLTSVQTLRLA
jgi:hypothetical protein